MCGLTEYADVVAPRTPISSCVVATLTTLGRERLFLLRQPDQGFADNVRADFVVEGACGPDAAAEELQLMIVGGHVANRHPLQRFRFRAHPNVDPDFVLLRHLLPILFIHQVDRALAGHAFDRAIRRLDDDAAS